MPRKSLVELPLGKKFELIKFKDQHNSHRSAAKKIGISKSAAGNIYHRRDEYISDYHGNTNEDRCRKQIKSKNQEINVATWLWFQRMRAMGIS